MRRATRTISISSIRYKADAKGSKWFSRGNMRFFGTQLARQGYSGRGGTFFATCERDNDGFGRLGHAWGGEQRCSLRQMDNAGNVNTICAFGAFGSMRSASAAAKLAARMGRRAVRCPE